MLHRHLPGWKHQTIELEGGYRTKDPLVLYWRDSFDVVAHLARNPIFAHCLDWTPYQLFDVSQSIPGKRKWVYTEFVTGDSAWDYQV